MHLPDRIRIEQDGPTTKDLRVRDLDTDQEVPNVVTVFLRFSRYEIEADVEYADPQERQYHRTLTRKYDWPDLALTSEHPPRPARATG